MNTKHIAKLLCIIAFSSGFTDHGYASQTLIDNIAQGNFVEITRDDKFDSALTNVALASGISIFSKKCRSSLPSNAVRIDYYENVFAGLEQAGDTRIEYYTRRLADTVYVDPKFERAYRSAMPNYAAKATNFALKEGGDINIIGKLVMIEKWAIDFDSQIDAYLQPLRCSDKRMIQFIENAHAAVSGSWKSKLKDTEKFTQSESQFGVKRMYSGVPAGFSPTLMPPINGKQTTLQFHSNINQAGLAWVIIQPFSKGYAESLGLRGKWPKSIPGSVSSLPAKTYSIAECTYNTGMGQATSYHWNAADTLPPASAINASSGFTKGSVKKCPPQYR